ncbi:hypothetical protein BGZ52_005063 [Haplosporangium bisporale]|nr:hypothetical protein BGZ52_005063 [Haplosporangium bisporale]
MEMTPTSKDHLVNDDPINFSPLNGTFSNSRKDQKRAKAISDAIDKSLRADKERKEKEGGIKLLILGTGGLGHSTPPFFPVPVAPTKPMDE